MKQYYILFMLALSSCTTVTTTTTLPNGNVMSVTAKASDPVAVAAGLEALKVIENLYANKK